MNRRVYLDYAATTPVDERVFEAMKPYLTTHFGNPSSVHVFGREAKDALEAARNTIARFLNASPGEIVFTGSGSEADNLAILGYALAHKHKGNHIITSVIEHSAVLKTVKYLETNGFDITYLPVDSKGRIDLNDLKKAITPQTLLITLMTVNNELGNINPIREIGEIAKEHGIIFHTDAVQAFGKMKLDMQELPVDLLSMGAHKIYGPKGVGALYVRRGVRVQKILFGGSQERDKRPGTENIAGIVGFAKAAQICYDEFDEETGRIKELRDYFRDRLLAEIPYISLNGDTDNQLFPFLNVSFKNVEGESLLLSMDIKGIAASAGSACASGAIEPSHVLRAISDTNDIAHTSIRFSVGRFTTKDDIDYAVNEIKPLVERIRNLSNY